MSNSRDFTKNEVRCIIGGIAFVWAIFVLGGLAIELGKLIALWKWIFS